MLVQIWLMLQHADFYLDMGFFTQFPFFLPSSYSYIVNLRADSADTFHSGSGPVFSNNWSVYQLHKLWNISEEATE